METSNERRIRIKRVAEITGISRQTLISWERRHGILQPERAANGYRYYSSADLQLLDRITSLLAEGHRIGEVAEILRGEDTPADAKALDWARDELGSALRAFDAQRVHTVSAKLAAVSFEERVDQVYLPLLIWIGDLWERKEATVAEEHNVSAHCRTQMMMMLTALSQPTGPRIVAAGFPGEHHENGLLAVSVKLALRGYAVTYLGADLPSSDVAHTAKIVGALVICQSIVLAVSTAALMAHAESLRQLTSPEILVVIGGGGLPDELPVVAGVAFFRRLDELYPYLDAENTRRSNITV